MATIKFKWNKNPDDVIKHLLEDVKATQPKLIEAMSKEIEVNARKNFNRAVDDISGDNPYVVVSRVVNGNRATISCSGEQVLYAEFGAGLLNKYREKEIYVESHLAISRSNNLFYVQGHYKTIGYNARGFKNSGETEIMPRPAGIGELGHNPMAKHTPSWGINDFWFRPSTNGRVSSMETWKRKKNGDIDPNYVWTTGTRPVRALYRARETARNKLLSGRLKIK